MDLNSLFGNLRNYEKTKALRKYLMRDSKKEKYVALVSIKEAVSLINDFDDSDQGEINNDETLEELVASIALIV